MEYRKLGKSDLKVSAICLGTMTFGTPVREKEAVAIINRAIESGINFIDTANIYEGYTRYVGSPGGLAEEIIGKALKDQRANVIIATKVGMAVGQGPNDSGLSHAHIMRELEKSLHRLKTDYIDICYLHKPDPEAPTEETIGAINEAITSGKIKYWGVSNFGVSELKDVLQCCAQYNVSPPIVCQSPLSLLKREAEKEIIPLCIKEGLGVVPYQVLQQGLLTGKYRRGESIPANSRKAEKKDWIGELNDTLFDYLERLERLTEEIGVSMANYAVAWALSRPGVSSVIIGVKRIEQLRENVKALGCAIPEKHFQLIDDWQGELFRARRE